MHGFYGRILTVDLAARRFHIDPVEDSILDETLGGKGLSTRLLFENNPPGVDPLAPENHIIFATGPFCNSRIWGASRYGVYTKAPLTGIYAESYSGGKVPEAIDSAGFDAVVITGAADRPTVLSVSPDGVQFHDASDLWGADTYETEAAAVDRFAPTGDGYGKPGAVVIGPAGERLLRFAVIENDKWRSAGRTGVGAVLGSKKVKAVVFAGDRRRPLFDPSGVADYCKTFSKENLKSPGVEAYRNLGTTMMVKILNDAGAFPSKYWSAGTCDHWEKISGQTYHQTHQIKPNACAKCFMACGRLATISEGRHEGLVIEGPEYETIYAFGGLCMIDDIAEIAYLNDICDRMGMDTITAGNLCAFTIEAALRGKVEVAIGYNDPDGVAKLLMAIANREGVGEVLAEGIVPAAKAWGLEEIAVHVKGMEPAGYDPRVLKGMGLSYATSDRGACHLRTTFYKPELAGMIPRDAVEGKAEMVIDFEDRLTLFDTLILCRFYRDLYSWEELSTLIGMVTGTDASRPALQRRASAIATLTKRFNLREGMTPDADRLPKRLTSEALPSGHQVTEAEMARMLTDYYRLRGWDERGVPPGR